jgi:hypothetical protein
MILFEILNHSSPYLLSFQLELVSSTAVECKCPFFFQIFAVCIVPRLGVVDASFAGRLY